MFITVEAYTPERWPSGPLQGQALFGVVLDDATGLRWATVPSIEASIEGWLIDRIISSGSDGVLCWVPDTATPWCCVPMEYIVREGGGRKVLHVPKMVWRKLPYVPGREELSAEFGASTVTPFAHLHCHSEFSALDGLATIPEMVAAAVSDGQGAIAVTDHGVCASHPLLAKTAKEAGIKPIFGVEAYLVDHRQAKETGTVHDYWHLILLAETDEGLRNIWAASTEAYRTGLFGKYARMDWDVLTRHSEGVICSTGCLRGPVADALRRGQDDLAVQRLGRLQVIYGDRLYAELHTNQVPDEPATEKRPAMKGQVYVNLALSELAHQHSIPMIVVSDAHYACADDHTAHQVWISAQTDKSLTDDGDLFSKDERYYIKSQDEVQDSINYLTAAVVAESMDNTVVVADRCHAALVERKSTPMYHRKGLAGVEHGHAKDAQVLREMCLAAWDRKVVGKPKGEEVYRERFETEMELLVAKNFCGYMLIEADICHFAKDSGILMGPGRGSAAGSLVCYLADITEVDPIEARLLFERFLTPGRTSLPDIDSDFPTSKRDVMIDYIIKRWGADHVVRVGTHIRLKNRGVMRDVARVLKGTEEIAWQDLEAVSKLIERAEASTAGMGMSWDELWSQHETEYEEFSTKYPLWFGYAEKLVGRLKAYGKHAAGVVIDPEESIFDRLPLRQGEDEGQPITEFDMQALELLGFVKFDILTLRTLDTIQMCLDLLRADPNYADQVPDIYAWRIEYEDNEVWDAISDGDTLGVFQIETDAGTRLTTQFHPQDMDDLCAILTLVRPGPSKSGLTASYLKRRAGEEQVSFAHPLLETVLDKTYGTMIYQEDIMAVCRVLAGYTMEEADEVRGILGKKKVDKAKIEGRRFIARCTEHMVDQTVAENLWSQMQEFAKYAFNRCVAWDSRLHLAAASNNSDGTMTVQELYQRLHLDPVLHPGQTTCSRCGSELGGKATVGDCARCRSWRLKFTNPRRGLFGLACHEDGRIRPARIVDVYDSGVQEVWRVELADGKSITTTANHRHLTTDGFKMVAELSVGDSLVIDGGYEVTGYRAETDRTTVGERRSGQGLGMGNWVDGGHSRLMEWTETAVRECQGCGHDGSERRLERAHLDGDRTNNDESNLAMLCVSCHKRFDYRTNGRRRRWEKGHAASSSEIVSITYAGMEQTYDVEMEAPHNLVVNGIVTHNSHSWSYAMLAYWTAWFKMRFPAQMAVALLSTVDKGRIPEFVGMAQRSGFGVLPPDVNESGRGFSVRPDGCGVRYGLDSIKGIAEASLDAIMQGQPYTSFDDFLERRGRACNIGHIQLLAALGCFDSIIPTHRASLEERIRKMKDKETDRCQWYSDTMDEHGLPCQFKWSEEVILGKSGKPTKGKPPPKKCTKACRNYQKNDAPDWPEVAKLSASRIRWREHDMLGVFLSSTPFDEVLAVLTEEEREAGEMVKGSDIEDGGSKTYTTPVLVQRVRERYDKAGRKMAFVDLLAVDRMLSVAVFSSTWNAGMRSIVKQDVLLIAGVKKESRGYTLQFALEIAQDREKVEV